MHGADTRQADAAFAELICADDQWLREEFDALIAANYQPPGPPPPAPPRVPPLPPRRRRPVLSPVPRPAPQTLCAHRGGGLRRQRSPPPRPGRPALARTAR
jgi:hypothetical protein